jgi:hypothetical protein
MSGTTYLRPSLGVRVIGRVLAKVFARSVLSTLLVPGRTAGRWRKLPVVVLGHGNERCLIAAGGHTEWSRNLRVAGGGRLTRRGRTEAFNAVPTFHRLPDPADHPTFRITSPVHDA